MVQQLPVAPIPLTIPFSPFIILAPFVILIGSLLSCELVQAWRLAGLGLHIQLWHGMASKSAAAFRIKKLSNVIMRQQHLLPTQH